MKLTHSGSSPDVHVILCFSICYYDAYSRRSVLYINGHKHTGIPYMTEADARKMCGGEDVDKMLGFTRVIQAIAKSVRLLYALLVSY